MKEIKKLARKFLRAIGGKVTYERAADYIVSKGYSIILYDETTDELYRFALEELAEQRHAFTYCENVKIIFIRRSIIEYEKLMLLLHEIGHIECNHLYDDVKTPSRKEYEANLFYNFVIAAPASPLRPLLFSALLIASLSINVYLVITLQNTHATDTAFISTSRSLPYPQEQEEQKVYYVTRTGKKYHTASCPYAISAVPIDAATAEKLYEPCLFCKPDNN